MKLRKWIALLLVAGILASVLPTYAFAAEEDTAVSGEIGQTEEEQSSGEETEDGNPESEENPDDQLPGENGKPEGETGEQGEETGSSQDLDQSEENTGDPDDQSQEETQDETELPGEPEGEGVPEGENVPEEEIPEPEIPELDPVEKVNTILTVTERRKLELRYDDRYSFAEISRDYSVIAIENTEIRSKQVSEGKNTGKADTAVLSLGGTSDRDVIATGVGTAVVFLAPSSQAEQAKAAYAAAQQEPQEDAQELPEETIPGEPEPEETIPGEEPQQTIEEIPCIEVTVKVEPARLSVLFLAGQSNMEGRCGNYNHTPEYSVVCPAGQVYSSYFPASGYGGTMTGIRGLKYITSTDASLINSAVPAALAGNTSMSGNQLRYPLYALTSEGKGKTGPDGAIAYEWNRLTGDKVWTINAAWTGSHIESWDGGVAGNRANRAFSACMKVFREEISAGHYTKGTQIVFWLQGEADPYMSAQNYRASFNRVKAVFSKYGSYFGIISVRAGNSKNRYRGKTDIAMTGPRIAQYCLANSKSDSNVFVVSNVNELWISDGGVKDYFSKAYPGGVLDYPTHAGKRLSIPKTEAAVHPDIHFTQIGHNENGLTAARGMYDAIHGKAAPTGLSWYNADGKAVRTISLKAGKSAIMVPMASPISASKRIRYQFSSRNAAFNSNSGTITAKSSENYEIRAYGAGGKCLNALNVNQLTNPSGIKTVNQNGSIRIKWNAVKSAGEYRVFYKVGKGNWKRVGDTNKTYIDFKHVKAGTTYAFTVRCLATDKASYSSGYNTKGTSITYIAPPVLKSAKAGKGTVTLTWSKSPKAEKYRVFYRLGNGKWTSAGVTAATNYTVKKLSRGKMYTFMVRCVDKKGSTYTSAYDPKGITATVK